MRTTNQRTIAVVMALFQAIQARKAAEKVELGAKKTLKSLMGSDAILEAGTLCVVRETRNRSDFDKVAFAHDHGQSLLDQYMKRSEYEIISVKESVLAKAGAK